MSISETDATKLRYKKVKKYLKKSEVQNNCHYFSEIKPSINDSNDLSSYNFHCGTYIVNAPIEQVWNTCMNTSPEKLWNGKMLRLSCVYSNHSNKMYYSDNQQFESLEVNQIYFINLRIIRLFNIAAALITTKIDKDKKVIEFTYIKGNKSTGRQTIWLFERNDGETEIVHETFYKSGSTLRDKKLYPRFHQIAITNLHEKIDVYSTVKKTEHN